MGAYSHAQLSAGPLDVLYDTSSRRLSLFPPNSRHEHLVLPAVPAKSPSQPPGTDEKEHVAVKSESPSTSSPQDSATAASGGGEVGGVRGESAIAGKKNGAEQAKILKKSTCDEFLWTMSVELTFEKFCQVGAAGNSAGVGGVDSDVSMSVPLPVRALLTGLCLRVCTCVCVCVCVFSREREKERVSE